MQLALVLAAAVALQDVTIIDTVEGKALPARTVVVRDGRVRAITTGTPRDAQVVPAKGKFLIPGLWDMHIHLRGGKETVAANEAMLDLYLVHGVIAVREMGGDIYDAVYPWRKEIDAGQRLGPRIFTSGPKLDRAKPVWPGSIPVTNPEEGRKAVAQVAGQGADLVKLYFDHLDPAVLRAITTEARKRKLKVAGHQPRNLTLRDFVEGGANDIQHGRYSLLHGASVAEGAVNAEFARRRDTAKPMTPLEYYTQMFAEYSPAQADAMIALLAKRKVWMTPTLDVAETLNGVGIRDYNTDPRRPYVPAAIWKSWQPDGRRKPPTAEARKLYAEMNRRTIELIPRLRDAGVPLLAGSDSGHSNNFVFPGWSLHEEMWLLRDAGLTNAEALRTATINAARFFKQQKRYGTVGKGKAADFVLLDANPLVDIRNTAKIAGVMRNGRWLDRKTLDAMLDKLRAANARQ